MNFLEFDEDGNVINDLNILDVVHFGFPRKVYQRRNYFEEMDNLTFFKRFRLTKDSVLHFLPLIEDYLEYDNNL